MLFSSTFYELYPMPLKHRDYDAAVRAPMVGITPEGLSVGVNPYLRFIVAELDNRPFVWAVTTLHVLHAAVAFTATCGVLYFV
jgi:hypothetical protein